LIPAAPSAAAEVFSDGFESGLGQWTSTTNFTTQSAIVKTGSFAGRATTSANDANASKTLAATQTDLYLRAFVNVVSHTGSTPLLRVRTATGSVILTVNVNATDKLATNNAITGVNRQSSTIVTAGFHEIQLHTLIGTSGDLEVFFDGSLVNDLSSLSENLGSNPVGRFVLGRTGSSTNPMDVVYDDVVASTTFIGGGGGGAPPTPTGLQATSVSTSQVGLSWNASSGATSYTVRRSDNGGAFNVVGTPSGTTFSDTTVTAGNSYQYTVEACNTNGCSAPSAPITVSTAIPATPTGLTTTLIQPGRVDLDWNNSSGATSYTVRRSTNGGPFNTIGTPTASAFADTTVSPNTNYDYTVDACNSIGCSAPSAPLDVTTPPASGGGMVVMAAGDIACDPADVNFNNGNGTATKCRQKFTGQLLTGANHVLPIGDTQYDCAGFAAYNQSYNQTNWGALKSISHPILSDEDYDTAGTDCGMAGADGYFSYFGTQAPGNYYFFDAGGWRFLALNSECSKVGGCAEGSAQNNFVEANAHGPTNCQIAMLHKPMFRSKSNGTTSNQNMKPFWDDLVPAGVELILGGDSHFYERFNPMNASGGFQSTGMVQFVVGTGGKSRGGLAAPGSRHPQSVTGTSSTFGVLKLTLNANSYSWQFMVEGSSSFTDSGGPIACHQWQAIGSLSGSPPRP
jgi:Chitinase A, N-terminal domain